jgi:predicted transcriptional regulator
MDTTAKMRLYLEGRGIALGKVADMANISRPRFYRMINGAVDMSVKDYLKICEAISVEPTLFMRKK